MPLAQQPELRSLFGQSEHPIGTIPIVESQLDSSAVSRVITWRKKLLVEALSEIGMNDESALTFTRSRLALAMWTCMPKPGEDRRVKEGASG